MQSIILIAWKDLKLLSRDKMASFFVLGFPILMGVFFGLMMGGGGSASRGKLRLAVVDQDNSKVSRRFLASLRDNRHLSVEDDTVEAARESVRRGKRIGMLVVPAGFGETAGIMWEVPPEIQIGMDPSRSAESAMIQGFVMESMGQLISQRFQNPAEFQPFVDAALQRLLTDEEVGIPERALLQGLFGSMRSMLDAIARIQQQSADNGDASDGAGLSRMQFAKIQQVDVTREIDPNSIQGQVRQLRSRWDISFPQAMMWGVMGCVAGFALSIAQERSRGTLLRLRVAPLTQLQLLAGKATACVLATILVMTLLTILGVQLGMKPASFPKLIVAGIFVAFCFVGIMMMMSTLGKSEEAVGGIGWAINMVMAMFGGCMIPVMFMPAFVQKVSILSPVHWSLRALEGAIWREFGWIELAVPFTVLGAVGVVGLAVGTAMITHQNRTV